jgi:hypothetical protein
MRPGQLDDRPTSVVTLPKFYGELGSDPDYHVREFLTACNANSAQTPSHWHAIFPTTLDGHARQWFHRQPLGHFANWMALKDAFIEKFRPVAYTDRLMEQMHDLQMTTNETIDNYYERMEDIILRLPPGHAFNDEMKKSIFIRGLLPFKLKAYVKEIEPTTLDEAYQRAKKYENIYTALNDAPVLSYINSNPVTTTQIVPISNPIIYPPQVGLQSTIKIPNPPMVNNQGGNQLVDVGNKSENDLLRQRLEDLSLQMGELRVHHANTANQRREPDEDRTNIWYTNCKGQGHLKPDCPSPPAFCGGHHDVISCKQIINLGQLKNGRQHQIYQVENDSNGNNNNNNNYNQNRGNNWNNRNNQNDNNWNRRPRYKNNNFNSFAPPGNLQSNFKANNFNNGGYRNNPSRFMPQNPPSQNQGWSQMPYGNPNQSMPTYAGQVPSWVDETVICFNCNQPGHIKPNCPNTRASIPYIPICGN